MMMTMPLMTFDPKLVQTGFFEEVAILQTTKNLSSSGSPVGSRYLMIYLKDWLWPVVAT